MKLRVNNKALPNVWSEHIACTMAEIDRRAVYVGSDAAAAVKVGEITYRVRDVVRDGRVTSAYGWCPALPGRWRLGTKVDAARVVVERATREGGAK